MITNPNNLSFVRWVLSGIPGLLAVLVGIGLFAAYLAWPVFVWPNAFGMSVMIIEVLVVVLFGAYIDWYEAKKKREGT